MSTILEYIMANYTWILSGIIIILLAIIGSYADKTNFGQGKQNDTFESEEQPSTDVGLNQIINENFENKNSESENEVSENKESKVENKKTEKSKSKKNVDVQELKKEKKHKDFEEQFEKFDQEFNEILPKKEIVNEDFLDDIDNLSLDKTQKLSFDDIPDLDDVDLPKIKNLKSDEDEDIWKF